MTTTTRPIAPHRPPLTHPDASPRWGRIHHSVAWLLLLGLLHAAPALADDAAEATVSDGGEAEEPTAEPYDGGYFAIGVGANTFERFIFNAELGHGSLFGVDDLRLRQRAEISGLTQHLDLLIAGGPDLSGPFLWEAGGLYEERLLTIHADLGERRYGGHAQLGYQPVRQLTLSLGSRTEQRELQEAALLDDAEGGLSQHATSPNKTLTSAWLQAEYRSRPDDLDPFMLRGLLLQGRLEQTVGIAGTDARFTRAEARIGYGLTLPGQLKVMVEGRAGSLMSDNPADVPFFDRYRLGGPYGFGGRYLTSAGQHLQLDPNDPTQNLALGGDSVVYGRVEAQLPVIPSVGLFVFGGVEGGGLQDQLADLSRVDWAASGYGGLRWLSPIGALSAGWGAPLNVPEPYREPIFLFQLGGAF